MNTKAKVTKLAATKKTDRELRIKKQLDGITAALDELYDTGWQTLNPALRAIFQSIRNDINDIWQETENYEYQKILAVVEAALGCADGKVDAPAIEAVLRQLIDAAQQTESA